MGGNEPIRLLSLPGPNGAKSRPTVSLGRPAGRFWCYCSLSLRASSRLSPSVEARPANPKIPACFARIADLPGMLKHSKFALNVVLFVRLENVLQPNSGKLREVSRAPCISAPLSKTLIFSICGPSHLNPASERICSLIAAFPLFNDW